MQVAIIIIGDELLLGQVCDSNSGFIARHIEPYGWSVSDIQIIPDTPEAITIAINRAFESAPIVLTTGGLGPTKDDLTKLTLCDYFGGEMIEDNAVLENVKKIVSRRGIALNAPTTAQAIVPSTAHIIQNDVGTAPIMWFERESSGQILVAMPGVPFETEQMFAAKVFPAILSKFANTTKIYHHSIMVEGITESDLALKLSAWEESLPQNFHLAYLPCPGYIRLRLDGHGTEDDATANELAVLIQELKELCRTHLLYDGDKELAEILLEKLSSHYLSVGTAESCTGGNIAHRITLIPGSSSAMKGGVVAYSNEVKSDVLNVDSDTLAQYGAVSESVVKQMVSGVQNALRCDVGIATSGIAGPSGGSVEKPVGTICIAAGLGNHIETRTFHFPGDRQRVINRATNTALIMAIRIIDAIKDNE